MAYSVFQLPIAGSNVKQTQRTQRTQRKPNDFYLGVLSVLCVEFNPRYEDLQPALKREPKAELADTLFRTPEVAGEGGRLK